MSGEIPDFSSCVLSRLAYPVLPPSSEKPQHLHTTTPLLPPPPTQPRHSSISGISSSSISNRARREDRASEGERLRRSRGREREEEWEGRSFKKRRKTGRMWGCDDGVLKDMCRRRGEGERRKLT